MVCVPHPSCAPTSGSMDITTCFDESVTVNDSVYTQTGTYTQHLLNIAGCDSTLTIHIGLGGSTEEIFIADCDSLSFRDSTYFTSTVITEQYLDQYGCDSTIHNYIGIIESEITTAQQIMAPDTIQLLSSSTVTLLPNFSVDRNANCIIDIQSCPD